MTLAAGNHIIKIDKDTKQPPENESHIEFEVVECASTYSALIPGEQVTIAVLKKIR